MKWFRVWFEKDVTSTGKKSGMYFVRAEDEKTAIEKANVIDRDLGEVEKIEETSDKKLGSWEFNGAYKQY